MKHSYNILIESTYHPWRHITYSLTQSLEEIDGEIHPAYGIKIQQKNHSPFPDVEEVVIANLSIHEDDIIQLMRLFSFYEVPAIHAMDVLENTFLAQ